VLRTLLTSVEILPTERPGERMRWRRIAFAPASGGTVVIGRRQQGRRPEPPPESSSLAA
jgi:hypothetical protein